MMVTRNLHDALVAIRLHFKPAPVNVWADAISINQDNISERNREVKRMHDVYVHASLTIIWLGEVPDDWNFGGERPSINAGKVMPRQLLEAGETGLLSDECTNDEILSFLALFERPYWKRVWIYQEIAVSQEQKTMFFWAGKLLPVASLKKTADFFDEKISRWLGLQANSSNAQDSKRNSNEGGEIQDATSSVQESLVMSDSLRVRFARSYLQMTMINYAYVLEYPLPELWPEAVLHVSTTSNCSDARDRVYGVLRLYGEDIAELINPDYTLPVERIFSDFAIVLIRRRGLDWMLFCSSGHISTQQRCPSWAIDFREDNQLERLLTAHSDKWERFCSGGVETADVRFSLDGYQIHCRAVLCGRVNTTGGQVQYEEHDALYQALMRVLYWQSSKDGAVCKTILGIPWPPSMQYENVKALLQVSRYSIHLEEFWKAHLDFKINGIALITWFNQSDSIEWDEESIEIALDMVTNMKMITTTEGRLGLGLETLKNDDHVAIVPGCKMPLILRPYETGYRFVGPCYIDGLMFGEALEDADANWTEITLF
jgi:Heterokaryon incompatibility protein (HET)